MSLAGPVEEEVRVGCEILNSPGLRHGGVTVIACPTCGRCQVAVQAIAEEIERKTTHIRKNLVVAVMGCAVNGPGEAREADVGITGAAPSSVVLFVGGDQQAPTDFPLALASLLAELNPLTDGPTQQRLAQ